MMDCKRLKTIATRGRCFTKRSFFLLFSDFLHFSLDKMVYFAIFGYRIGYRFDNQGFHLSYFKINIESA